MAIKQREGEDFSDENVEKVINALENGETKKSCCDILGINYNTARLAKIIDAYNDAKDLQVRMRKSLRNKPLEKQDIIDMCQSYLNGDSLTEISNFTYRTVNVIKNVLKRYGIPLRNASNNYFNPVDIEDETPDDYVKGDLVFSARYNSLAEIHRKIKDGVYSICVLGDKQRYACQPSYELADLRKVQVELGVKGEWQHDTRALAWKAVIEAKRKKEKTK